MPLQIHRASRADQLADGLGELLRTPLPDPFASELVVVPAKGVERWLSQRLSHLLGAAPGAQDGVCAGIELRSPRSLVAEVTSTAEDDPWAPDRIVWPLLEVVDGAAGEDWARVLSRHLGLAGAHDGVAGGVDELRRGRRYATARRLAGLFASYARQRPALLRAWEAGHDEDGSGLPLPEDLGWQAELWRRLLDRTGEESPVVRHAALCERLRGAPADLPPRISLFGHTRVPLTEAELLAALGEHHDVHLWLPHPSPVLWDSLAAMREVVPRREDPSYEEVRHPLLASLGRDVRELERTLLPHGRDAGLVAADPERPATLLGWLQQDVAAGATPTETTGRVLDDADRSLQVHACHGPARQVEVLREVVLGLLAEDETLEPRNVMVMCPDVEAYAPLVEAAFGLGEAVAGAHPGHQLQVRLADRALSRTNPLLAVAASLLDLADGRAPASLVLDLLSSEPVRRRFRIGESELETVQRWVEQSGVRWAFDAGHRAAYGLEAYPQNTWRFGLDRVLAGVAVSDDAQRDGSGFVDTILPLDDVSSGAIDLAGRLAEMVERLATVLDRLGGVHPMGEWLGALREGTTALTAVEPGEEWQLAQLHQELTGVEVAAGSSSPDLRLSDVRSLMGERLGGRPTRANFRTGSLTVATLVPMRSVPHRVVCLLGLDDGVFPRAGVRDGDDVLARRPMTGERDARSEDRQQLLDALMAATEKLVVTYSGFDETTGARRPPAVPLGELLDACDRTVTGGREHVVRHHRIQPFHPSYFTAERPFSFDDQVLRGARARTLDPRPEQPLSSVLLDPPAPDDVDVADLVTLLASPVATFLRLRLEVSLLRDHDEVSDRMPVEMDGLATWGVGDRLLHQLLAERPPADALQREWRRGELPPGTLGWTRLREVARTTTPIAEAAQTVRAGVTESAREVRVEIPGAAGPGGRTRRLVGTVSGLHDRRRVSVGYSKVGPKQELDAWVNLVALEASAPGRGWTSTAVGRSPAKDRTHTTVTFRPPEDAGATLATLLRLHDAALRGPLPLPLKTAYAFAQRRLQRGKDLHCFYAAKDEWSPFRFEGEQSQEAHTLVWGERAPLEDLLRAAPLPGEEREGEPTRLGALAAALWAEPLGRVGRS